MFFKVKTSEEVFEILRDFGPSGEENLPIENCIGRILSRQIIAPDDLPGYYKSTMDGYAVKAKDTFGASESIPALLELVGEVLMGEPSNIALGPGQAVKISTGGMVPENADGVVMVEYSAPLDEKTIEISRAISPLENIIRPDDDFKKGAVALIKGQRLRAQDLGLMAGLGISDTWVYERPRVAIISTGDEIIPIDQQPESAQVRDINSYTLGAFCRQAGVEPVVLGLCEDRFESLKERVEQGLAEADTVWISGGSSVGTRDMTLKVLESFKDMELLVHGISISPGKPTIIARVGKKALFGLPGHTASAMVVAEVFLPEFLSRISGEERIDEILDQDVPAELSRNIESVSGRDDYIRVKIRKEGEKILADPIFGKSGLISTLVEAHGLLKVDRNTEGLYQGDTVMVRPFKAMRGSY